MQTLTWIILSVLLVFSGILSQQTFSSKCISFQRFPGTGILNMTGLLSFTFRSSGFGNCSITCYSDQSCGFFSYDDQSAACSGFSAIAAGDWEPELTRNITGTVFYRGLHSVFVNDSVSGLSIALSNDKPNGTEAHAACSNSGERLLVLDSFAKRQRITTLMTTLEMAMNLQAPKCWIGLAYNTHEGSWFWNNGVPLSDVSPLSKTFSSNKNKCVQVDSIRERFHHVNCSRNQRSICEK